MKAKRVVLIVLDSVGIGALPDASLYGDAGSNTLGHIAEYFPELELPNLTKLGLGNIDPTNLMAKTDQPQAAYGKAIEQSAGKDTTTGHWELCGVVLDKPFPTFPDGFPRDFLDRYEKAIGTKTIGNKTASGTVIINELGEEHLQTRCPIVYTSADSVFQIAMHEALYPIEQQYEFCQIARKMLSGDLQVGRVIARPFIGEPGDFTRTKRRKDFSIRPPKTLLNAIQTQGLTVQTVGKITDIFSGQGIDHSVKTANNEEGIHETIKAMKTDTEGLIFTNLVDFDMHYGHRRDIPGYAHCLMAFDKALPNILTAMKNDDLLIITADHGNDPSAPGTDHTREYIPILVYGKGIVAGNLGVSSSFADIGATIAEALEVDYNLAGDSFLAKMTSL